jgi:hypothetical protein
MTNKVWQFTSTQLGAVLGAVLFAGIIVGMWSAVLVMLW